MNGGRGPDPFAVVWEEIRQRLELEPGLQAKTLFEHLQRTKLGRFANGHCARPADQAVAGDGGPAKDVFFALQHQPGELCQSDFTHWPELGIAIGSKAFPQLIYHFVLSYSTWERESICCSETSRV
jgi:hypothetical protein